MTFKKNKCPQILFVAVAFGMAFAANAAQVLYPTSIFDAPSEGAKQLRALKKTDHVKVSGEAEESSDNNFSWVPVEIDGTHGYAKALALELESGDVGYAPKETEPKSLLLLWGSAGPTLIDSNSGYFGARIAAGGDFFLGEAHRASLGLLASKPFTKETLSGRFAGEVQRIYFFPNFSFYPLPEKLWIRGMAGFGFLSANNKDVVAKIKPAVGLGLGYRWNITPRFNIGVELTYEYSGSAKSSWIPVVDGLSCALGDCEATGTVPQANIWSLNFVFGVNP